MFEPFFKVLHRLLTYIGNFCLLEVFAKKAFIDVSHVILVPLLISSGLKMLFGVLSVLNIDSYRYPTVVCGVLLESSCCPLSNGISHMYVRISYNFFFLKTYHY